MEELERVKAPSGGFIERLENCNTFVQEHPHLKTLLEISEKTLDVASKAVDLAWDMVSFTKSIAGAGINPEGAVGAAFAGSAIAKKGIDFIRAVAPSLDTDEETKKIENNVFKMVGGGATTGASIGGIVGVIGGPPGIAIGATLGGLAGTVIGAVGIAFG